MCPSLLCFRVAETPDNVEQTWTISLHFKNWIEFMSSVDKGPFGGILESHINAIWPSKGSLLYCYTRMMPRDYYLQGRVNVVLVALVSISPSTIYVLLGHFLVKFWSPKLVLYFVTFGCSHSDPSFRHFYVTQNIFFRRCIKSRLLLSI